jgi:benzoyl-CoA reductase/2-hydroxyglutaryl-CoA dehydratase subunit BcrC/BadD/HgdB
MGTGEAMDLVYPFVSAKEQRIQELDDLRMEGRKIIGSFCLHIPPELVEAAGGIPLRLCQMGDTRTQLLGEGHTRSYVCPFIKACLGHREANNPWFVRVDAIAACSTCDQMRHMADVWQHRLQVPTYVLFKPRGQEKAGGRTILHKELVWLTEELAVFTGRRIEAAIVQTVIERYNTIRTYLTKLHHLRINPEPPLSGAEWLTIVQAGFVLDSTVYAQLLQDVFQACQYRSCGKPGLSRIMLVGGMLAEGDTKIVQAVEQSGKGVVVTDALCTGTRVISPQIRGQGDLYANIWESHCQKVPCIHARPNTALYDYIDGQIQLYRVDGVIFHSLKFCDGWGGEALRMQHFIKQRDIPSLIIDTDYSAADAGQITTRIEAFLEMLLERKRGAGSGV